MCGQWEGRWLRFPEATRLRRDTDGEIILTGFHKDHLTVTEPQGEKNSYELRVEK